MKWKNDMTRKSVSLYLAKESQCYLCIIVCLFTSLHVHISTCCFYMENTRKYTCTYTLHLLLLLYKHSHLLKEWTFGIFSDGNLATPKTCRVIGGETDRKLRPLLWRNGWRLTTTFFTILFIFFSTGTQYCGIQYPKRLLVAYGGLYCDIDTQYKYEFVWK